MLLKDKYILLLVKKFECFNVDLFFVIIDGTSVQIQIADNIYGHFILRTSPLRTL